MNAITTIETQEQIRAAKASECALTMLTALQRIHSTSIDPAAVGLAAQAIEYASGETDPGDTPDGGYAVDAAGAAQG